MTGTWKLVLIVAALAAGGIGLAFAQAPATPPPMVDAATGGPTSNWRPPSTAAVPASGTNLQPVSTAPRASIAKVTSGTGTLPNDAGQVWREYDITPYTLRVTSTNRPEQAIVDWILRETGYEAWHSDPLGMLSANGRTLRVYHTPQMQEAVSEIVDRFVNTQAESTGVRCAAHHHRQPKLASENAACVASDIRANSRRASVGDVEGRRRDDVGRVGQAHRLTAITARRSCWCKTASRPSSPARGRATTSKM